VTPERLAKIEALHAAATEGPWWFDEDEHCWRLHGVAWRMPADPPIPEQVMNKQILKAPKKGTPYAEYWPDAPDAAFIAAAWSIVGELLADRTRQAEAVLGVANERNEAWRAIDALEARLEKAAKRIAELEADLTAERATATALTESTKYGRAHVEYAAGCEEMGGALPRGPLPEVEARATVAHWRESGHVSDPVLLRRECTAWHRVPLTPEEADEIEPPDLAE